MPSTSANRFPALTSWPSRGANFGNRFQKYEQTFDDPDLGGRHTDRNPPRWVAGGARIFSIIDAMIIDFSGRGAFFRPFHDGFRSWPRSNMRFCGPK
jgi:hypothetical protein